MINATVLRIRQTSRPRTDFYQQETFEVLATSCWDALWRYAYRTTGNRDDAEDLLSESLLEGFKSFHQFRGETQFVRWMYRIMTNTRIDYVRREGKRQTISLIELCRDGDMECGHFDITDENANLERLVISPMLSETVQQALLTLPDEFRAVIILADMEEMDYAEVSKTLQIPIGTVRSRLHRGRSQLRQILSRNA